LARTTPGVGGAIAIVRLPAIRRGTRQIARRRAVARLARRGDVRSALQLGSGLGGVFRIAVGRGGDGNGRESVSPDPIGVSADAPSGNAPKAAVATSAATARLVRVRVVVDD
jgi:hypothetical protein